MQATPSINKDRLSINQICFMGVGIAQLEIYWRELDVKRVGCLSSPLLDNNFELLRDVLVRNQWQLETVAHVFLPSGNLSIRESVDAGRERLTELIDRAEQVNARSIYMMTGGRGNLSWEQAADSFSEAIAPCITRAKDAGITLAIENAPAVYADVHVAHTLNDALTLAEMANVGICIEVFACWAEAGLQKIFERALPRCCLVQLSDYVYGDRALPARAVPGDGVIPLKQIIAWLLDAGYQGAFDLELIGPRIENEGQMIAAHRAVNYLDKIFHELSA